MRSIFFGGAGEEQTPGKQHLVREGLAAWRLVRSPSILA